VVGWILTLVVLARGGGYLVVVPHLAFVLPLAVVGTVTALAAFGVGRPVMSDVLWLAVVVAFGVFWNFLIYWAHFGSATWGLLLPLVRPAGVDFRDGLYEPAAAFTTATSGWPPLTLLLGRPFTLVSSSTAYAIQVVILVALALAATVLSAVLAMKAVRGRSAVAGVAAAATGAEDAEVAEGGAADAPDGGAPPGGHRVGPYHVGIVAGLWLVTSYGFMYEIERGNIDLYALFFALLSVWLMVRLPRSPWWPAIALAISINLKLYPGVLLVLLFWRYRWRAVIPAIVTNAVLLLAAGPANVLHTVTGQSGIRSSVRPLWWGNHSAAALANVLQDVTSWSPSWIFVPLIVVPLALWAGTMVLLVRRGWSDRTAVLAAAACVPVMSVVPSISHDYKLVLYVFPLAVLVAFVAVMTRRDLLVWSLVFGLLAWAMLQLSRSSLVIEPALLSSKYALIVLVQVLLLFVVWRSGSDPGAFAAAAGDVQGGEVDARAASADGGSATSRLGAWFAALGAGPADAADERAAAPADGQAETTAAAPAGERLPTAWLTRRTVCLLLLILAVAVGANFWVGIVGSTFNDLASGIGVPQHDFYQYYAGGHNWELGVDPYLNHPDDPRVLDQPRHDRSEISGYIYPPSLLPLFGALAGYDYDVARTLWLVLNVCVFSAMALVAVAVSRGRRLEVLTAAVLLTMVSFAFFYHVHEGQIDMIVAGLSIGAFLLYPRWKGWPSAALFALAVALKVSPILIVAVVVVYFRDWRFLLKTLACGAVVLGASMAFVDFSLYREYFFEILPQIAGSDPSQYNQTPLRFWWRYPTAVKVGSALGYAALIFLAWVAGRNTRRLPEADRRVDRATERHAVLLMAVLLMLLFSPLAWQMAYVWVIVPLALVLVSPPPRGREWAVLVLAVAAALLSMRMWPYRVLDMTNIIGAAVAALCLMRYYLPLERVESGPGDGVRR